jgi:hypothetical protein
MRFMEAILMVEGKVRDLMKMVLSTDQLDNGTYIYTT